MMAPECPSPLALVIIQQVHCCPIHVPILSLLLLLLCSSLEFGNSFTSVCHAELRKTCSWLFKTLPPYTVIAPLSTTSKMQVLCTSSSYKSIWGSVVTFPQGLIWIRTGFNSFFLGNIHTKASICNLQFHDASQSMKSCSPLGGQLSRISEPRANI